MPTLLVSGNWDAEFGFYFNVGNYPYERLYTKPPYLSNEYFACHSVIGVDERRQMLRALDVNIVGVRQAEEVRTRLKTVNSEWSKQLQVSLAFHKLFECTSLPTDLITLVQSYAPDVSLQLLAYAYNSELRTTEDPNEVYVKMYADMDAWLDTYAIIVSDEENARGWIPPITTEVPQMFEYDGTSETLVKLVGIETWLAQMVLDVLIHFSQRAGYTLPQTLATTTTHSLSLQGDAACYHTLLKLVGGGGGSMTTRESEVVAYDMDSCCSYLLEMFLLRRRVQATGMKVLLASRNFDTFVNAFQAVVDRKSSFKLYMVAFIDTCAGLIKKIQDKFKFVIESQLRTNLIDNDEDDEESVKSITALRVLLTLCRDTGDLKTLVATVRALEIRGDLTDAEILTKFEQAKAKLFTTSEEYAEQVRVMQF